MELATLYKGMSGLDSCFRIADGLYFGKGIFIGFEVIADVYVPAIHIDAVKFP